MKPKEEGALPCPESASVCPDHSAGVIVNDDPGDQQVPRRFVRLGKNQLFYEVFRVGLEFRIKCVKGSKLGEEELVSAAHLGDYYNAATQEEALG